MTAITFGLSATFPGETEGQPWDEDWVEPVALMDWTDTFYKRNGSTDDFYGDGATYKQITGNSVDVGPDSPDLYDVDHIGFWFDPHDFAIVNIINYEYPNSVSELEISLATAWNSIKDIEFSSISSQTCLSLDLSIPGSTRRPTMMTIRSTLSMRSVATQ
jgi:hypothetical protein